MSLPFSYVCDLLETLNLIVTRDPPFLPKEAERVSQKAIYSWFAKHGRRLETEADGNMLLNTLLPELRTDRVYRIQVKSLEKIIARALALPNSRRLDLQRWRDPGAGDLADCVERVLKVAEMALCAEGHEVTIEEIDNILLTIASHCRNSSPEIQMMAASRPKADAGRLISPLYHRLQAREAKWFTRLILKNYAPVMLSEWTVYSAYHYLLPDLMKVQAQFPAALHLLHTLPESLRNPGCDTHPEKWQEVMQYIVPIIGVKVGRQRFYQARSINHCIQMAGGRRMAVEKKYDGEYCQIHVEMARPHAEQIKIFSKSGKDSTADRRKVCSVIRKCLRLDEEDCEISKQCILEGELLVYSDRESKILAFHKIRKHVSRSGSFLGVEKDSQPHDHEHLCLTFFDILLLDDKPILQLKQSQRVDILEGVVQTIPGYAGLVERNYISFSSASAASQLRQIFAKCITTEGEGLVVKPADDPYFSYGDSSGSFRCCCIKMKKGYFAAFGDIGDFVAVGASYDATKAKPTGISGLKWTDFYLGCLENKEEVMRWDQRPKFVVVAVVTPSNAILRSLVHHRNLSEGDCGGFDLRIEKGIAQGKRPAVIFGNPFIFDVRCFGFDKEGNTGFWTVRFPQVSKVHYDRDIRDTVTFQQLQEMADVASTRVYDHEAGQEDLRWIQKLEAADCRGRTVDMLTQQTSSPSSSCGVVQSPPQTTSLVSFMIPDDENSLVTGSAGLSNALKLDSSAKQAATIPSKRAAHRKRPITESSKRREFAGPLADITDSARKPSQQQTQQLSPDNISQANDAPFVMNMDPQTRPTAMAPYPTPPDEDGTSPGTTSDGGFVTPTSLTGSELPELAKTAGYQHNQGMCPGCNSRPPPVSCVISQCTFALAPCISQMALVTDDLLPQLGALFISDLRLWLNTRGSQGHKDNRRRARKIVLVDRKLKDETVRFMRRVEGLGLRRRGGKKEWVEVYDWRLLQHLARQREGMTDGGGSWREYWVGAV